MPEAQRCARLWRPLVERAATSRRHIAGEVKCSCSIGIPGLPEARAQATCGALTLHV